MSFWRAAQAALLDDGFASPAKADQTKAQKTSLNSNLSKSGQ